MPLSFGRLSTQMANMTSGQCQTVCHRILTTINTYGNRGYKMLFRRTKYYNGINTTSRERNTTSMEWNTISA